MNPIKKAMLESDDPRIVRMAKLMAEGEAAAERGDYEAAHGALLKQRDHAIETGAPSSIVSMFDKKIAESKAMVVGENKYARQYGDGHFDLTALGVARWLLELSENERKEMGPAGKARWSRILAYQERVRAKVAVAEVLGQSTDVGDAITKVVDLDVVKAAIRAGQSGDPVEAVLASSERAPS